MAVQNKKKKGLIDIIIIKLEWPYRIPFTNDFAPQTDGFGIDCTCPHIYDQAGILHWIQRLAVLD